MSKSTRIQMHKNVSDSAKEFIDMPWYHNTILVLPVVSVVNIYVYVYVIHIQGVHHIHHRHVGLHRSAHGKYQGTVLPIYACIVSYPYVGLLVTTSNYTNIYTGILHMFHIATYIPVSKFDLYWAMLFCTVVGGRKDSNSILTMTELSDRISQRKITINYCYFVHISSLT